MGILAYLRVSTDHQTTDNQKLQISERYQVDKWFVEHAVSGLIPAAERPAMKQLMEYCRENDTIVVVSIDRLGRNCIDVLSTVEHFKNKGVSLISMREGFDLNTPIGNMILTVLISVSTLEKDNLKLRQIAGINRVRAEKGRLGREKTIDDAAVRSWRIENNASIKETSEHFNISIASVKRAMTCAIKIKEAELLTN